MQDQRTVVSIPFPEASDTAIPLIFETPEDATYAMQELMYNLIPCFLRPVLEGWKVSLIPAHMKRGENVVGWAIGAEDDTLVLCDDFTWKTVMIAPTPGEVGH